MVSKSQSSPTPQNSVWSVLILYPDIILPEGDLGTR